MRKTFKKVFILLVGFFVIQVLFAYLIIHTFVIRDSKKSLHNLINIVYNDLKYKEGKWDTSLYNSDSKTPHPNGSSGFSDPLYIITNDGFVIERNQPISGFFDASDFKRIISFHEPQTIEEISNESWRVYSLPLKYKNNIEGVIFVSFYNPDENDLSKIDEILISNAQLIKKQISFNNKDNNIDVSRIDIRNIHYQVSFEIVNNHNIVLINNGRTPSLIDPSYIANEVENNNRERVIKDKNSQSFLVLTKVIYFKNAPIGIIITGKSLSYLYSMLQLFIVYSIIINFTLIFPLSIGLLLYLQKQDDKQNKNHFSLLDEKIHKIIFYKNDGNIKINDHLIKTPYSSNQYYLCLAIFSKPKKKYELDEILKMFGEDENKDSWRKVYDTLLAINKKTGMKLFVYEDKRFFLNPKFDKMVTLI